MYASRFLSRSFGLLGMVLLAAGCSETHVASSGSAPAAVASLRGSLHGGQQPVSNAVVKLYAVGTGVDGGPATELLAPNVVLSGADGSFTITGDYKCPDASTLVYVVGIGGNPGLGAGQNNPNLTLEAVLGSCGSLSDSTFINVNELTTVAAVAALAPYMSSYSSVGSTPAHANALASAFTLASQLASVSTGTVPGTGVPAGNTVPTAKMNTLADILASCVNTGGGVAGDMNACGQLFGDAGGVATTDTIGAALYIALHPTANVSAIYNIPSNPVPFQPELGGPPNDWTVELQTTPAITWNAPSSITYGAALSGTQLNASSSVAGTFSYSPAAGTVLTAGTQALTATFVPSNTSAYTNATASVNLTVNQAVPALSWGSIASINYGTALSSTQLNATASVPGTFVYNPAAGTVLPAGTQTLNASFTPTDKTDYISNSLSNSITVNNPTPSYTWNNVQIVGGGFVTGIVAHPTAQNVRYARTDVGGAYRWNQSTGAWVPLLDFISRSNSNSGGVEAIGLDPSDPSRLYLAAGEYAESFGSNGEFLLSSDQGNTFTAVPVSFKMGSNDGGRHAGERLAVDPNLGTKMYYGTRLNGLYVSTNRGANWSQVSSFPVTTATVTAGAGVVFVDFVKSSGVSGTATPVIYVGVSDTGTSSTGYSSLYRSIDSGATWQAVPGQPTGFYPSHGVFAADGNLYLSYGNAIGPTGLTGGALYQYAVPPSGSPGGAGSWSNITPVSPVRQSGSQGGFGTIAIDPERPGVLMATTMDDYYPGDDIFRSQDYGAHWVSLNQQGKTHNASLSPWVTFGSPTTGTGNWPGTLVIDPFNSSHVLYGNGQTIWDSTNITVSDSGSGPTFSIGALGLEETVSHLLISPPSGPAVVSAVSDLGGFTHSSVSSSPAGGMNMNPIFGVATGLAFAQNVPATMVRVGTSSTQFGAYSTNSGSTWTPFAVNAGGTTAGQGSVAISANGSTIVWAPSDTTSIYYSTNNGSAWTASSGAIAKANVFADRVNPLKFYIYSGTTLQISTDGGHTFANVTTSLPSGSTMHASYAAEGDLWLSANSGLLHSTNSGSSFSLLGGGITQAYDVGFGKTSSSGTYPALYLVGVGSNGYGFYRSTDQGVSWILMNDAAHQYGYVQAITGDPKIFGRVYLTTGGRGVIYGDSAY